jgi:hypothetical protein
VRWVALAALLAAAPAFAQPMAGGAVPPPRQRSGMPIGDQNTPAGTLSVRVVHDEETAYADPGTPVHLVGVKAKGGPTLQTARTGADGRVQFSGLDHDQSTTYYALVVIGDDRLESQLLNLPPQVGMRMIFSARKRVDGKPVGEPIDDQDRDRDVPKIPPGEVWVAVQGRFDAEVTVHLRRLGDPAVPAKSVVATGEKDRREARFTGVPGGPEAVYVAEVVAGQRIYRSVPFMLTESAGASRAILVYEKPLVALQGGGMMDDDRFGVEVGVNIVNLMGAPYDPGEEGMVVPLPDDFFGGNISDENNPLGDRAKIVPETGLVITGVLPPGQTNVVLSFLLPVEEGRVHFSWPAPFGLYESRLFIERGPKTVITSPKLPAPQAVSLEGREYYQVAATIPPEEKLEFDILGLPKRPASERHLRWIVGALALALLAWGLAVTMRGPRAPAGAKPKDARRVALEHDKERLYADLVGLEKKRRAGDLDDGAYEEARKSLVARLVLVHRELDELSAQTPS